MNDGSDRSLYVFGFGQDDINSQNEKL